MGCAHQNGNGIHEFTSDVNRWWAQPTLHVRRQVQVDLGVHGVEAVAGAVGDEDAARFVFGGREQRVARVPVPVDQLGPAKLGRLRRKEAVE